MSFTRLDHGVLIDGKTVGGVSQGDYDGLASLFKALGHDGRLAILHHLSEGERSVTELETLLGQRQAAVSQQLARLRLEGMVTTRRQGKAIYYALSSARVRAVLRLLPELHQIPPT